MNKNQSGAVLIISLIILFSLTLLVLSSSQVVLVQEKMTSAVRDMHISLEIAQSGIADAENKIENLTDINSFDSVGKNGLYSKGNGPTDIFDTDLWRGTRSVVATTNISDEAARYFIEDLGLISDFTTETSSVEIKNNYGKKTTTTSDVHVFKIVARSLGGNGNSERIIMDYYTKCL